MPERAVSLCCAGLLAGAVAWAQPLPPGVVGPGGPGGTVAGPGLATRPVAEFLALERRLASAVAAGDTAAVQALLDPSFDARSASSPDPIDSAPWLRLAQATGPGRVRELNVRQAGPVSLVSFLLDHGQGRARRTEFVVDAWQDGRLLSRMSAHAAGAPPPHPGPSGRE